MAAKKQLMKPATQKVVKDAKPTEVEPRVISDEEYRCTCCGHKYKKQETNFGRSKSPIYKGNNGFVSICKNCVAELYEQYVKFYDGDEDAAAERICQITDMYFDLDIWASSRKISESRNGKSRNRISTYISRLNLSQVDGATTYSDTLVRRWEANVENAPTVEDVAKNDDIQTPEEVVRRFGVGFDAGDYDSMQYEYQDWVKRYGEPMDTGLQNGVTYYVSFFPTSTDGAVNTSTANRVTGVPNRLAISTVPRQSGSLTYTGNTQSPSWSNYDSSKMTLGGVTSGINAGSYNATFTPKDDYCWSDGSTSAKTVSWAISKAAGSLSLSATSVVLNSSAKSKTVTVTRAGDGAISAQTSDASVAKVSVSGNVVTIQSVNDKTGTATITIRVAAGTNHTAPGSKTVAVSAEFLPAVGTALNDCSWEDISKIAAAGLASQYWSVGATKTITINGKVGTLSLSNLSVDVFILGFDHNSSVEGSNRIHFQIGKISSKLIGLIDGGYNSYDTNGTKYFNMNHWGNYNYGGWAGCDLRYDVLGSTDVAPSGYGSAVTTSRVGYNASATCATNPVANTLMAALPADLRAVMKGVTKYADAVGNSSNVAANVKAFTDYLFLLAEFEVQGTRSYANQYEQNYQKQYAYYSFGNSKVMYRHSATGSTAWWWLRSACYDYYGNFCNVITDGGANFGNARHAAALAPGFVV